MALSDLVQKIVFRTDGLQAAMNAVKKARLDVSNSAQADPGAGIDFGGDEGKRQRFYERRGMQAPAQASTSDSVKEETEEEKKLVEVREKNVAVMNKLIAAAAAYVSIRLGAHLKAQADEQGKATRQAGRDAEQYGVTTKRLQELGYAYEQLGLAPGEVISSFEALRSAQSSLAMGSIDTMRNLGRLGLSMSTLKKLPLDQQLLKVSDSLAKIENPTRRAYAATQIFGASVGNRLAATVGSGTDSLRAWLKEAEAIPPVAKKTERALADLDKRNILTAAHTDRLSKSFSAALAPILIKISEWIAKLTDKMSGLFEKTEALNALVQGAAAVISIKLYGAIKSLVYVQGAWNKELLMTIGRFALMAAGIASIILLFDEVKGLFQGKKTLIGALIDELAGIGTVDTMVRNLAAGLEIVKDFFKDGIFSGGLKTVNEFFNSVKDFFLLKTSANSPEMKNLQRATGQGLNAGAVGPSYGRSTQSTSQTYAPPVTVNITGSKPDAEAIGKEVDKVLGKHVGNARRAHAPRAAAAAAGGSQ